MSDSGVVYAATGAAKEARPEAGMVRQVLAYNPHLMLVRHRFTEGWAGARHSHPHHQLIYVTSGRVRLEAEGRIWELRAGDSAVVEGGVEHRASALEDSEVLDVFTPYREDYA